MPGQMGLKGAMGSQLYELARRNDVFEVLEIGTWNGEGSTWCLACGLSDTIGRLTSIEVDEEQYSHAERFYQHSTTPVDLVNGLTVTPADYREFDDYAHLIALADYEREAPGTHRMWYEREVGLARAAKRVDVLRDLIAQGRRFDMVLFDGGEYASSAEFQLLEPVIDGFAVFDDTNVRMSIKNAENRERVADSDAWQVVRDEPDDRCGWTVAKRR